MFQHTLFSGRMEVSFCRIVHLLSTESDLAFKTEPVEHSHHSWLSFIISHWRSLFFDLSIPKQVLLYLPWFLDISFENNCCNIIPDLTTEKQKALNVITRQISRQSKFLSANQAHRHSPEIKRFKNC